MASCQRIPVTFNTTLIQEMSEAHYLSIFPRAVKVLTQCSSSKIMVLEGVFLIQVPPGCEFKTNNEAFFNSKTSIQEEPWTLPKIVTQEEADREKLKPIKLEKISLDKLHTLMNEEEHLEPVQTKTWTTTHTHFWTTPLYIAVTLLLISAIYLIRKRCNRRRHR
jgi:hypothetical protein